MKNNFKRVKWIKSYIYIYITCLCSFINFAEKKAAGPNSLLLTFFFSAYANLEWSSKYPG